MWCSFSQTVVQSSGESAAPDYALPASGLPGAGRKEGGGCAGRVRGSLGRPLPAPGRGLLVPAAGAWVGPEGWALADREILGLGSSWAGGLGAQGPRVRKLGELWGWGTVEL